LKLKSLVVITLFVLGCSAAFAQGSATLGYADYTDSFLYCNYEIIAWGGSANFYAAGIDNLQNACFLNNNATMEGVKVSVSSAAGAPVAGLAYGFADNLIDAIYGGYTAEQWYTLTLTKPSRVLHKYGWVSYLGFYGYEFFGNYGYLSASIPGAKGAKPNSGKTSAAAAHQNKASLTKMVTK